MAMAPALAELSQFCTKTKLERAAIYAWMEATEQKSNKSPEGIGKSGRFRELGSLGDQYFNVVHCTGSWLGKTPGKIARYQAQMAAKNPGMKYPVRLGGHLL